MTVYNHDQTDFYVDEDGISAFTGDDTGETIIIAEEVDGDPPEPPPASFFGFLRLALWQ